MSPPAMLKLRPIFHGASSLKVPSVQLESLTSLFIKSGTASKLMHFKNNLYERAVGQHLYKSTAAHSNPCRFGDFEVKGRASDF